MIPSATCDTPADESGSVAGAEELAVRETQEGEAFRGIGSGPMALPALTSIFEFPARAALDRALDCGASALGEVSRR